MYSHIFWPPLGIESRGKLVASTNQKNRKSQVLSTWLFSESESLHSLIDGVLLFSVSFSGWNSHSRVSDFRTVTHIINHFHGEVISLRL